MKESDVSILCVEDEPMTREFLSTILSMKFPAQKVHTAENGEAGLELFKETRAGIVLTDINMPVMDGIRMAREIRQLAPEACIIALSAYTPSERPDVGTLFTEYILKPFVGQQLFQIIEECLAKIVQRSGNGTGSVNSP